MIIGENKQNSSVDLEKNRQQSVKLNNKLLFDKLPSVHNKTIDKSRDPNEIKTDINKILKERKWSNSMAIQYRALNEDTSKGVFTWINDIPFKINLKPKLDTVEKDNKNTYQRLIK